MTSQFRSLGSSSVASASKCQQHDYAAPHNALDSSAPRVKRGKEREIPKVKRPTALKKVGAAAVEDAGSLPFTLTLVPLLCSCRSS